MALPRGSGLGDGVYMFIRFPALSGNNVNVVGQTCVLSKRCAENCRGRFVGIARKVYDFDDTNARKDEGLAVFHFQSSHDAHRFFCSDARMKQPDFPPPAGTCNAWTVTRYYTPEKEAMYTTFMMSEVRLTRGDYSTFKEQFARPFARLLLDYDAHPFVVQSVGVDDLRRYYTTPDTIVTVHLFKSPDHLREVMDDPRYLEMRRVQCELATDSCSVFTIDPRACP